MKKILTKIGLIKPTKGASNPAYEFFVNASSREKKKVYTRALEAAQEDQLKILNKKRA
jgi:hypothetical protein